jgi:hypothetical protein
MKYLVRLRIKCARLENIYNYNTHSSINDWLKTFKKRKDRRFSDSDKCFFLITLLGTSGSLIPTYEKLGTGVFQCFLTHLCIVRLSVTTGRSLSMTTRRTDYVTRKRKVMVDAEKNDGKKMRRP